MPLLLTNDDPNHKESPESIFIVARNVSGDQYSPPALNAFRSIARAVESFRDHFIDYGEDVEEYPVFLYHQTFLNDHTELLKVNLIVSSTLILSLADEGTFFAADGSTFKDPFAQYLSFSLKDGIYVSLNGLEVASNVEDVPEDDDGEAILMAAYPNVVPSDTMVDWSQVFEVQAAQETQMSEPFWAAGNAAGLITQSFTQIVAAATTPILVDEDNIFNITNVVSAGAVLLDMIDQDDNNDEAFAKIVHGIIPLSDYLPLESHLIENFNLNEDQLLLVNQFILKNKVTSVTEYHSDHLLSSSLEEIGIDLSFLNDYVVMKYHDWLGGIRYVIFLDNGRIVSVVDSPSVNVVYEHQIEKKYSIAGLHPDGLIFDEFPIPAHNAQAFLSTPHVGVLYSVSMEELLSSIKTISEMPSPVMIDSDHAEIGF